MEKPLQKLSIINLVISVTIIVVCCTFEGLKQSTALIECIFPERFMLEIKSIIFSGFAFFEFSVAEVLILLAVLTVIMTVIFFIKDIIKTENKIAYIINFIFKVIIIFGIIYIFFMIFCGIDYYRSPIEKRLGLEIKETTKQQLIDTCDIVLEKLNLASVEVRRDQNGLFVPGMGKNEMLKFSNYAYSMMSLQRAVPDISFSKPKGAVSSEIMNYMFISGFYFPFTGEANVNMREGDIFLPFVICHEKAHQYGVMREQDANFLSFLVCIQSQNSDFVYSGYLKAFVTLLAQVNKEDKEAYKNMVSKLSPNIKRDINEYNKMLEKYEGPISNMSEDINNSYLILQGQKEGVKSYGKMADLIIAKYTG